MSEQRATYKVDKCQICGIPIAIHSSDEGTCFATPLYIDARDRVTLALELEREHVEVLRLRATCDEIAKHIDVALNERDDEWRTAMRLRGDIERMTQQRDSARKWATRWKRVAKKAMGKVKAR